MAARKQAQAPVRKRAHGRGKLVCALLFAALVTLVCVMMSICGVVVHVKKTDVGLKDLPDGFDGVTVLLLTDLDVSNRATLNRTKALLGRLQALKPDVILLGGDYMSEDLLARLNRGESAYTMTEDATRIRAELMDSFNALYAPMGKYAVLSGMDTDAETLGREMAAAGITLLQNNTIRLTQGGENMYLAGLSSMTSEGDSLMGLSGSFSARDCVIVLTHSPDAMAQIQTAEAGDGGAWADLVLCGSTHGGQICLTGHTVLKLTARQRKYLSGWFSEGGTKILVSQGLGCECVQMRLGSEAQAHLLTLRKEDA